MLSNIPLSEAKAGPYLLPYILLPCSRFWWGEHWRSPLTINPPHCACHIVDRRGGTGKTRCIAMAREFRKGHPGVRKTEAACC